MAVLVSHNTFRDVSHVVKFNGDNYNEYKYEFLGMMEQLGLKNMLEAPEGRILTLPAMVTIYNLLIIMSFNFITVYHSVQ